MIRAQTRFGNGFLGTETKVVGTVARAETLAKLATGAPRDCDIVEMRLDGLDANPVSHLVHAAALAPTIVTIRLANEGGKWTQPDADRLPLFDAALRQCTAADVEFRSPILQAVSEMAVKHQKALIVSYHDFEKTPPLAELRQVLIRAANYGTVVKIATLTRTDSDLQILRELFKENCSASLCALGMGPLAAVSRRELPRLGSCLVYGYIDEPVAPGQPAARDLRTR